MALSIETKATILASMEHKLGKKLVEWTSMEVGLYYLLIREAELKEYFGVDHAI